MVIDDASVENLYVAEEYARQRHARSILCLPVVKQTELPGQAELLSEALDRDVRKPHKRPTLGLLLCASKDNQAVEYALSRSPSRAMIAEYQIHLPDKQTLAARLREFYLQQAGEGDGE